MKKIVTILVSFLTVIACVHGPSRAEIAYNAYNLGKCTQLHISHLGIPEKYAVDFCKCSRNMTVDETAARLCIEVEINKMKKDGLFGELI